MLRRTRTELVETIERSRAIYGPLGWVFHEQDKVWRVPNGARLRFAYLERDSRRRGLSGPQITVGSMWRRPATSKPLGPRS